MDDKFDGAPLKNVKISAKRQTVNVFPLEPASSTRQEIHDSTMKSLCEMNSTFCEKSDDVRAPTKFQQNEHTPESLEQEN